ncbi:MAG: hypothetical protein QOI83_1374 [Streptomycetaceae bacterium]|nr:hypothetical protein [Streptomycetaceae bacterium]
MSTGEEALKRDKAVVDAYYQAAVQGNLPSFGEYLHPDFVTTAPNYLPWGGRHDGAAFFRDEVLPNLPDILDFSRYAYESFKGEDGHVGALIRVGVTGTDSIIKISERWEVKDGMALSMWVAYFEPKALMNKLGL